MVDGVWLAAVPARLAVCDGVRDSVDLANSEDARSERSRSSRTYAARSTDSAARPRPEGGRMFGDGGEGEREM